MKRSLALRLLEQAELWMYRRAVRIVTLTNAFKANLVQRGIRAAKIGVVLNGVDVDRYAPQERNRELAKRLDLTDEHFVLGYIGTLGMAHGMRNVLCAAAMDEDPNTRYLLVGPGAERSNLLAEAQRMMLRNVVIVPAQPKETIPSYWSLCDVALVHLKDLPLFETVIPSKIFEAMGMGLPILLAAPQGEASELLATNDAGLWVQPERPGELLKALRLLKNNPSLRLRMAERSRAAAPHYSRERQARDMLFLLQDATEARAAAMKAA